jgi:hypothetical protein
MVQQRDLRDLLNLELNIFVIFSHKSFFWLIFTDISWYSGPKIQPDEVFSCFSEVHVVMVMEVTSRMASGW